MSGKLYLVATPIGNLDDMTFRAIDTLKNVDYIAAEDTRHSLKLMNHFDIEKRLESYHEHNKVSKGQKIIDDLLAGMNVGLITDAGTPAVSDPGEDLVRLCYENDIEVTSVPGAVALITGLILSGKNTRRFAFEGFLPFQNKERKEVIELLKTETRTIILYEAPHKLKGTLDDLYKGLGNREITITRELTKRYEEVLRFDLETAILHYKENDPRGEYVLIVEGISMADLKEQAVQQWELMSLEDHMAYYLNQNISKKEAVKLIAKDRNNPKKEIYNYFNK